MILEALFVAFLNEGLPACTTNFIRIGNRIVCEEQVEQLPPESCWRMLGKEICISEKRTVRRNEPLTKGLQRSIVKIAPKPQNRYARPSRPSLSVRPTQRSLRKITSYQKDQDQVKAMVERIRAAQKAYMLEKFGQ